MSDPTTRSDGSKITGEQKARCRSHLELAKHNSLMEGVRSDPRTDHIFEAYVEGELELSELLPLIRKALGDE